MDLKWVIQMKKSDEKKEVTKVQDPDPTSVEISGETPAEPEKQIITFEQAVFIEIRNIHYRISQLEELIKSKA